MGILLQDTSALSCDCLLEALLQEGRTKGVTVKGEDAASHGDEAGRGIWATVMAIKKKN